MPTKVYHYFLCQLNYKLIKKSSYLNFIFCKQVLTCIIYMNRLFICHFIVIPRANIPGLQFSDINYK